MDEMPLVWEREKLDRAHTVSDLRTAIVASLSKKGQGPFKKLIRSLTGR